MIINFLIIIQVQYDLYAKTGDNIFLFSPKEYGLIPQMRNTACIRGYWCEFDINDKLILKNMYVFAETYPEINGVNVNPIEYVDEEFYVIDKLELDEVTDIDFTKYPKVIQRMETNDGFRLYENINLVVGYTGKMLLTEGDMANYRQWLSRIGAYAFLGFKKVIELEIDNGIVINTNDYSSMIKQMRKDISKLKVKPQEIEDSESAKLLVSTNLQSKLGELPWWFERYLSGR